MSSDEEMPQIDDLPIDESENSQVVNKRSQQRSVMKIDTRTKTEEFSQEDLENVMSRKQNSASDDNYDQNEQEQNDDHGDDDQPIRRGKKVAN